MTATSSDPRPRRTSASQRSAGATVEPVREVCPYLEAAGGGWRSVEPTRDHRCTATDPASPLTLSKQRELCLLPAHFGCATYHAARELVAESQAPADGGLWPETRGAILSLEPARGVRAGVPSVARGSGQAVLIALMVVAFILLVITRVTPSFSGDAAASFDAGAVGSLSPGTTPASTAAPVATPPASEEPSPGASGSPAARPSSATPVTPSAVPPASPASTSYTVRTGDTLSAIAIGHGVTVRALKAANAITDIGLIRPGQVLVIPSAP
jgi:LysM repeat protein